MQNNTTTKPLNQNKMNAKLYKTEKENYVLVDPTKGTYDDGYTLGTSRESQYNKLSMKNCQTIENGYDLDELTNRAFDNMGYHSTVTPHEEKQFKLGYRVAFREALEVNSDKRFTLKEMVECWNRALEFQTHKETLGEYIKSLRQTEWEVSVVMKNNRTGKIINSDFDLEWDEDGLCDRPIPKLDADGCLILKRID